MRPRRPAQQVQIGDDGPDFPVEFLGPELDGAHERALHHVDLVPEVGQVGAHPAHGGCLGACRLCPGRDWRERQGQEQPGQQVAPPRRGQRHKHNACSCRVHNGYCWGGGAETRMM